MSDDNAAITTSPTEMLLVPSIDVRLKNLRGTLALTKVAVKGLTAEDFDDEMDRSALVDKLAGLLDDAINEVYWISLLPDAVLGIPAPDDDEEKDIEHMGRGDRDELALSFLRDKLTGVTAQER